MKRIYLISAVSIIFMLGACSRDKVNNDPEPIWPSAQQVVKFRSSILPSTRATETNFENGDEISVFAVQPSAGVSLLPVGNYVDNIRYVYSDGLFVPVMNGINLPNDLSGLSYYAVYKYSSDITNEGLFTVNYDQSTHEKLSESDFCTAYVPATSGQYVDLTFSHRLSRIIVNLEGSDLGSSSATMQLTNVLRTSSYDLNANTFVGVSDPGDIQMMESSTNRFEAIMAPQTVEGGSEMFSIIYNGEELRVELKYETTFRSGRQYEYTISVDEEKALIISGNINPWNTDDERLDVVVPVEIQDDMNDYMPIYTGINPPNVEGSYYIHPFVTVYCEDEGNGGYHPGDSVRPVYIRFYNQNLVYNTLDFMEREKNDDFYSAGNGAFISGYGNNFTAFFNTEGVSRGIENKTALVISGTMTENGIKDLYYSFVMVEKGDDPDSILMEEGYFRVFKDEDGLAENAEWPESAPNRGRGDYTRSDTWTPFSCVSSKK